MLAIAFRFPAGHYHATPWGRHVNEADVEWPPAPWRLLRALLAIWHRKMDPQEYPESTLARLISKLAASLPVYQLPSAIRAHSRHYMPVREGKRDKPVLIFDAFVRLSPNDPLIACWPEIELRDDEQLLLEMLLRNLGFLGRAESWVEAELIENWNGKINCRPSEISVDTETGEALDAIRLIAPMTPSDYSVWREEIISTYDLGVKKLKRPQQLILETLPGELIKALCLETGEIQAAGWSCPPGARFVTYQRPYGCFMPQPKAQTKNRVSKGKITSVRLALAGKPLPRIEDAVKIGELLRMASMRKANQLIGSGDIPTVLSGHDMPADNRHGHAFYLPEDADSDGHIEHIIVHAENGLAGTALRAIDQITRLWDRRGADWQVLLEQYGLGSELEGSRYMRYARTWVSATPYLHPWFRKKNFNVADQIRRECCERGLPTPILEQVPSIDVKNRQRRPVHFYRFRNKRGLMQPDTKGSFWKLTFDAPISGPVALGFGCHFGLGMFRAVDD